MNFIPVSLSQEALLLDYLWYPRDTEIQLSAIQATGDFNSDYLSTSEIVVGGQGKVMLVEVQEGNILDQYTISPNFSYNALAVGNLDTDASNEIVAGSLDGNLLSTLKYYPSNESLGILWELPYNVTQIEVSDVTGDSLNEVIIGDSLGNLTVLFRNSTIHWFFTLPESITTFKCLDFSQNGTIDAILVLTDTFITLLNTSGSSKWQVEMGSKPLNVILGDIRGNSDLEIIVKCQNFTNAFDQNGFLLWNSTSYITESPTIILYDYTGNSKSEILLAGINGSYFLNGTDGAIFKTYLSDHSVSALGISNLAGDSTDYLIMGSFDHYVTFWTFAGEELISVDLTGVILDIILLDMNADGIADIITATANGIIFVIGRPDLLDFTWIFIGIGIGAGVIIVSIYLVIKKKKKSPEPTPNLE